MTDRALALRLELLHGSFHAVGNQNAHCSILRRRVGCGQERSHCCNRRYDQEEEAYSHLRNYMESRRRNNKNNCKLIEFRPASTAHYKLFLILPLLFPSKPTLVAP